MLHPIRGKKGALHPPNPRLIVTVKPHILDQLRTDQLCGDVPDGHVVGRRRLTRSVRPRRSRSGPGARATSTREGTFFPSAEAFDVASSATIPGSPRAYRRRRPSLPSTLGGVAGTTSTRGGGGGGSFIPAAEAEAEAPTFSSHRWQ